MTQQAVLMKEIEALPPRYVAEALDFVGYLKQKAAKRTQSVAEPCPLCAKYTDPETGEPRFNAETLAAFAEGDAMERGEIPSKLYNSFEEMLADLDAEDGDE